MLSSVALQTRSTFSRLRSSQKTTTYPSSKPQTTGTVSQRTLLLKHRTMAQRSYSTPSEYLKTITTIDCNYMEREDYATAYLVTNGKHAAFIDNNTNHCVPTLMKSLEEQGLAPENVDYIIITHVHLDHAGATGALAELCPNATVLAHPVRHHLFSDYTPQSPILETHTDLFPPSRELLDTL